jgi:histidine phosphotransferase ChpT
MLEIDRDAVVNHRLHLPKAPVGLVRVPDKVAGFEKLDHRILRWFLMAHSIDALVSSRICHDLISPVGAIGNGVELLEGVAATMPEIGLIADSVDNAKAKLRFFRICFGQMSDGAQMSASEAEAIATAMIQTQRLQMEWRMRSADFPRERVKLLFLLLLCVETALPIGGTIVVSEQDGVFVVRADGKRIQMQDAWRVFEGETIAVTPAQVQFPLAQAFGGIQVEASDTSLTVRF